MSREPKMPTWFPDGRVDPMKAAALSSALQEVARMSGITRETYAVAVAQMAEALTGLRAEDDIDGEVLRFVSERLSATATAINGSA